ncbi:bacteriorhodopsin [Natronobacterium gregoryi]|uniref:Rhodopsin n=2 Tax=Natronobacterium gregoryi TaxID=44930 RepID=L0AIF6_NATGS|nr:bacteriorhodopsin [Natronobacterium gregoryi]AFZ73658.1 bacteriorhodopsin [Natronobacterium gregoryi SP2]ELY67851.1 rhodopsin [Natronobacterium gregoryi SP2]PLK19618.1 rhodopsin [Natronobacterium gregoryi SP2]SFJ00432.1 Bacteriorhodopsin [Natronobacterium gregoryi]
MIEHGTLFAVSSGLLGAMTVAFLLWAFRVPVGARSHGYAVVIACGSMSVAYALMSTGVLTVDLAGRTESVTRFLGYTVGWSAVCLVLGAIVDADRQSLFALVATVLGALWAAFASWFVTGVAAVAVSLVAVGSLVGMGYVLLGPFSRNATRVGGQRALLYAKLKFLILLVFVVMLTLGTVSEQQLGLTSAFVGQTVTTYLDLVWLLGFGGLVLRYADALESEHAPSPLSIVSRPAEQPAPSTTDVGSTE